MLSLEFLLVVCLLFDESGAVAVKRKLRLRVRRPSQVPGKSHNIVLTRYQKAFITIIQELR
jgi:hypothetical protein